MKVPSLTFAKRRWLVVLLFIVAAGIPFVFEDFTLFQLTRVMCLGIAVISLDLLTGHAGQISAGHGALFGLGAYTTIILVYHLNFPSYVAILVGVVVCFLVGLLIGLPALRIRGLNLGLITLAAALLFPALLKSFDSLTGGVFGLGFPSPNAPLGIALTNSQWLFLVSLVGLGLVLLLVSNVLRSRFGTGLDAIRVDENMALSVGINVRRSKVLVFALSSAIAGFGGGLYQLSISSATPDTYSFLLSLSLLFAAVVGGLRSRVGALIGAAFIVYIPDYTAALGDRGPQLVYAAALLLVVYLMPGGIVHLLKRALALAVPTTTRRLPSQDSPSLDRDQPLRYGKEAQS